MGLQLGQNVLIHTGKGRADFGKAGLDQIAECLKTVFVNGDLDTRLIFVVAAAKRVPDADDRLDIWQQVFFGQVVANDLADHWCPTKAAANDDLIARLACLIADHAQTDVMRLGHGAVIWRAGDRDLELARQELEFRVVSGPLTKQFCGWARIFDFVGGSAGKMVSGHVADGVARCLDGVHFNICQSIKDIRHVLQFRPVELDVLTGGPMAIALVPFVRDERQLAHLCWVQRPIRDRNPQHIGMQLQI